MLLLSKAFAWNIVVFSVASILLSSALFPSFCIWWNCSIKRNSASNAHSGDKLVMHCCHAAVNSQWFGRNFICILVFGFSRVFSIIFHRLHEIVLRSFCVRSHSIFYVCNIRTSAIFKMCYAWCKIRQIYHAVEFWAGRLEWVSMVARLGLHFMRCSVKWEIQCVVANIKLAI